MQAIARGVFTRAGVAVAALVALTALAQQSPQALFHSADIDVMPEPGLAADPRNTRLVYVDLPWMEIENARLRILPIHPPSGRAKESGSRVSSRVASSSRPRSSTTSRIDRPPATASLTIPATTS